MQRPESLARIVAMQLRVTRVPRRVKHFLNKRERYHYPLVSARHYRLVGRWFRRIRLTDQR